MSTSEDEAECDDQIVDAMSNFGGGLGLLMALAEPAAVTCSLEEMLETFAAFEAAHESLAALQAEGKVRLDMGSSAVPAPVVLSDETFALVRQLGAKLRLPPKGPEAEGASPEIRSLASECLKMLTPGWESSRKNLNASKRDRGKGQ